MSGMVFALTKGGDIDMMCLMVRYGRQAQKMRARGLTHIHPHRCPVLTVDGRFLMKKTICFIICMIVVFHVGIMPAFASAEDDAG